MGTVLWSKMDRRTVPTVHITNKQQLIVSATSCLLYIEAES